MKGEEDLGMDMFDIDSLDIDSLNLDEFTGADDPELNPQGEEGEEGAEGTEGAEGAEGKEKDKEEKSGEGEDPENVAKGEAEGDESEKGDSGDSSTSPNLYTTLATVLFEEGVIPSADSSELEKIQDVSALVETIQKQVKANEFANLNDIQKEYLQALEDGLPAERFDAYKRAEASLDSVTPEMIDQDEKLRQNLIFRDFKSRGYSDEKAARLTKRSFDSDDDVEDAKSAYETLRKNMEEAKATEIAQIKKQKEDAAKRADEDNKKLKELVFNTDEVIKGFAINEGLKKQIFSNIMNPVGTNPETGRQENALMKFQRENPQDFMHKLYYLFTATKGFKDFSYFGNKVKSNSIKELEKAITTSTHVSSGGDPSFLDDPESFDSIIGDELVLD